jgi:carbamoyltransferase
MLYERVTEHLGFQHSSDEYKVMALASYGRPRYRHAFDSLVELRGNGDYRVGPLGREELTALFGPVRRPGEPRVYFARWAVHAPAWSGTYRP